LRLLPQRKLRVILFKSKTQQQIKARELALKQAKEDSISNAIEEKLRAAVALDEKREKFVTDSIAAAKAEQVRKAKELADQKKAKDDSLAKAREEQSKAALAIRQKFVLDSIAVAKEQQARKAKEMADAKKAKEDSITKVKEEQRKAAIAVEETRKKFVLDSLTR